MPEVAEVRRYVDQLNAEYGGHTLQDAKVVGGRFLKDGTQKLLSLLNFPLKNTIFNSKGKFMYWTLLEEKSGVNIHFFITLGMAGSFGNKNKHSALEFTFDNGVVYFNDIRHFGTFKPVITDTDLNKKLKTLGWDPLQNPAMPSDLITKLRKRGTQTVAEVLLEQKLFAGVGNYIRSEALYMSKIHPSKLVYKLTDDEIKTLCDSIINIAKDAYNVGGATIATYSDLYGNVGTYYNQFKVYGKKTDPLGNKVLTMTAADGRTVHYVKEVQGENE